MSYRIKKYLLQCGMLTVLSTLFPLTVLATNDFRHTIQSVFLQMNGNQLYLPIISLQQQQQTMLEFDYLVENYEYNLATIVKICDKNFNPVDDISATYLNASSFQLINNPQSSATQFSQYIHFSVAPFKMASVLRSGNYVIQIVDQAAPSHPLFVQPIIIYETSGNINITTTGGGFNFEQKPSFKCTIKLTLNEDFIVYNPLQRISVYTFQNGDWNTRKKQERGYIDGESLRTFVFGGMSEVMYNYPPHYFFQTENLTMQTMRTTVPYYDINGLSISVDTDTETSPSIRNAFAAYPGYVTVLNSASTIDKNISAEYAYYHFSFQPPEGYDLLNDIFLVGSFNHYRMDSMSKLDYNVSQKQFKKTLYLKQGHYQYMYAHFMGMQYQPMAHTSFDKTNLQTVVAIAYYQVDESAAPRVLAVGNIAF